MKTITVGVPKEIKNSEYRVAITPSGVKEFKKYGHRFLIESNAGLESGFTNADYAASGAEIINNAEDIWKNSEMIIKVKEPQPSEYKYLRPELLLFTYLHLAAEFELAQELINSKVNSIAYETVELKDGTLPLLTPMSEIAGKMSVQIGASLLEHHHVHRFVVEIHTHDRIAVEVELLGGGCVVAQHRLCDVLILCQRTGNGIRQHLLERALEVGSALLGNTEHKLLFRGHHRDEMVDVALLGAAQLRVFLFRAQHTGLAVRPVISDGDVRSRDIRGVGLHLARAVAAVGKERSSVVVAVLFF